MVWFSLWKSEKARLQREYDCTFCLSEGLDKKRDCTFTQINPDAKSEFWVSVPEINSKQTVERDIKGQIKQNNRRVEQYGFIDILIGMSEKIHGKSLFELYLLWFDEVCLTAFADNVMFGIIEAESTASEYKGAVGGLDSEEVRFGLLGFSMEYEDLIEVFNIVRRSKSDYERYRTEQIQQQDGK